MTREEAIKVIEIIEKRFITLDKEELQALDMAIKALESQPRFLVHSDGKIEQIIEPCDDVLYKIRADVINIADGKQSIKVRSVLRIIDKYKAESENKNESVEV